MVVTPGRSDPRPSWLMMSVTAPVVSVDVASPQTELPMSPSAVVNVLPVLVVSSQT